MAALRAAVYEGFRMCCWVRGCLCWLADVVGWVRAPVEGGPACSLTCLLYCLYPCPARGGRIPGYYLLAGVTTSGRGAARARRGCPHPHGSVPEGVV